MAMKDKMKDQIAKHRRLHNVPKGRQGVIQWKALRRENNLTETHINMALRLAVSPGRLAHRAAAYRAEDGGRSIGEWIENAYRKEFGNERPPRFRVASQTSGRRRGKKT